MIQAVATANTLILLAPRLAAIVLMTIPLIVIYNQWTSPRLIVASDKLLLLNKNVNTRIEEALLMLNTRRVVRATFPEWALNVP